MALEDLAGSAEADQAEASHHGPDHARGAWARRAVTVLVVAVLLWPVAVNEDGLPLSTYPMYAGTRSQEWSFVAVRAHGPDGSEVELSMMDIARTRDPLIAQSYLNDSVASGDADRVCSEITARVGTDVHRVVIAVETHNTIDRVAGRPSIVERRIVAECEATT